MTLKQLAFILIYCIAGIWLVFLLTDFPLSLSSDKNDAAIAIRDNVSNLEKNGSLVFTGAYLKKRYLYSIYLTQNSRHDQENEFVDSLSSLLKTYDKVDVYLLAHHNFYYELLNKIDPVLTTKINLIYNTGCSNAYDSPIYKSLGADIYVAHQGRQSLSPIFYFYFLRRMCTQNDYSTTIDRSNAKLLQVLTAIGKGKEIKEHEGILF